jgi:hypothetical protein
VSIESPSRGGQLSDGGEWQKVNYLSPKRERLYHVSEITVRNAQCLPRCGGNLRLYHEGKQEVVHGSEVALPGRCCCSHPRSQSGLPPIGYGSQNLHPDGDCQRSKGVRSQTRIPSGKIEGFRKIDKVRYCGKTYFVKGRYSTGCAILMDQAGEKFHLKPIPKFGWMKRISRRKS